VSLAVVGLSAAAPAGAASGPTADVWVTNPDGSQKMAPATPATFEPGGSEDLTVTVDPTREYQTMRGFGASITDSSARLLAQLPKSKRDATMADLFGPGGDRLSVLRQPMGASDFVAGDFYTYDDMPAGQTDYDLSEFSINHDRAEILPLVRQAMRLNPHVTVVATPWSPPAWMKTNDDLVGGRLIDDPKVYATYAQYFVKFVRAYAAARVPVHAVTLQNEPQNRNPRSYPGMGLPAWQERKLAVAVDAAFTEAGLHTKILGYDHNWATHPDDVRSTPAGEDPETDYPYRLLGSPEAGVFDGIAYHCYAGEPLDQTRLHDAYPDTELWFTECSGSHGATDPPAQVFGDTLKWHARNLALGVTRNWGSTVVNWNLALDPSGGPHTGGCDTCTGVVTVGPRGTVTRNAEYYTLGHLSRFVDPGAVRIASSSYGSTGWNGKVMSVAFRNPDGQIVLVAHNENDAPSDFAVAQGDQSFDYSLPGGALATFVWDDTAALDDGFDLADTDAATATSTTNGVGTEA
jgi:glucosylceramidase